MGDILRCDSCKTSLSVKNIGYVQSERGHRTFECRRCHSHKRQAKTKKLSGSWMLIS